VTSVGYSIEEWKFIFILSRLARGTLVLSISGQYSFLS